MALDWIPRAPAIPSEDMMLQHQVASEEFFGTLDNPPCTVYEKRPVVNPQTGEKVEGLYTAWIILNNPAAFNSYTIKMVKGMAAGLDKAAHDKSVVMTVMTGVGTDAWCTGGNVKEYSEYYIGRPAGFQEYLSVYSRMMEGVWTSPKPVIRRANGISIGGGEEMGGCADLTVASDLATFGQVGPLHGSAAVGGACQFKPVSWTLEDAIWNCLCGEQTSAYKMFRKNYVHKVVPVLKQDGKFIRNPQVITDKWIEDGEIVYGEFKTGDEFKEARALVKSLPKDLSLLDKELDEMAWVFTNLYPLSLGLSLAVLRQQKRLLWDKDRAELGYWMALAGLPYGDYDMGMTSFNTKKITGTDTIDMIEYRRLMAKDMAMGPEFFEKVMGKPKK